MRRTINFLRNSVVSLIIITAALINNILPVYATEESADNSVGVAVIEVQSYRLEAGSLEPGKEATIKVTLHNTSTVSPASYLTLTTSSNSGAVYPSYGQVNQIYVGTIGAGSSRDVSIPFTITSDYTGKTIDIICKFDYLSADREMTNTATIVIPLAGSNTLDVKTVEVSAHANVGGKSLLSIGLSNNSVSNINDARIIIEGNVTEESKSIELDAINSGKNYSKDCQIVFTQPGEQEITISIEYTDETGEICSEDLGTYKVMVSEENDTTDGEEDTNQTLRFIGLGIAGAAVIALIIAIIAYFKKR